MFIKYLLGVMAVTAQFERLKFGVEKGIHGMANRTVDANMQVIF